MKERLTVYAKFCRQTASERRNEEMAGETRSAGDRLPEPTKIKEAAGKEASKELGGVKDDRAGA